MSKTTSVGNLADLHDGQVVLPGFIRRVPGQLDIDLSAIDSRELFLVFVERVFAADSYFAGLDYDVFINLAFRWTPADIDKRVQEFSEVGHDPFIRLADDIRPFPPERRALYRGVKILEGGRRAEYFFEKLVLGEDEEGGEGEVVHLDCDEFIADLWTKGVRFGVDVDTVRKAIEQEKTERVTIARFIEPRPGKDASIVEQSDKLHRDDAPKLRPDGRIDLRQYSNRFPQVSAGTCLFRKLPRVAGISGWNVDGRELLPNPVKDFNIETVAGPGTRIVRNGGAEWVEAAGDGFLDIDDKSGQVSVVDKIVNRAGVSMRTTGDLSLAGDEYEEHGEVQEKRVVNGHHMTFLADVFGEIRSDGGRVLIKSNLSGGAASSASGTIIVEGTASSATIEAHNGEVELARAESCLIVARKVRIQQATRCDIVADEVVIGLSEGSAIAARNVVVEEAAERRDEGTTVVLLMPDIDGSLRGDQHLREERDRVVARLAAAQEELKTLSAQDDLKVYMTLSTRIKSGALVMSPKQEMQWQEMLSRLAPVLRSLTAKRGEVGQLTDRIAEIDSALEESARTRGEALSVISCAVRNVTGYATVRQMFPTPETPPLNKLSPKELHSRLREPGDVKLRLFSASFGEFEWRPEGALPATESGQNQG
jgi:hypothetical protein